MTTREYLLSQAITFYDTIAHANFRIDKVVLDLSLYTKRNKALILYNHLYFSQLSKEQIRNIVETGAYRKIVNHENYNPRIIETMCMEIKKKNIDPHRYAEEFLSTLNNPKELWKTPFTQHISALSRKILIGLFSFGGRASVAQLRDEYVNSEFPIEESTNFDNAIEELEGSFIRIDSESQNLVNFLNPSVRDYIKNYISGNLGLLAELVNRSKYFEQIYFISLVDGFVKYYEDKNNTKHLIQVLFRVWNNSISSQNRIISIVKVNFSLRLLDTLKHEEYRDVVVFAIDQLVTEMTSDISGLVKLLKTLKALPWLDSKYIKIVCGLIENEIATMEYVSVEEFHAIDSYIEQAKLADDSPVFKQSREAFEEFVKVEYDNISSICSSSQELDEYSDELEKMARGYGSQVSRYIDRMREKAEEWREEEASKDEYSADSSAGLHSIDDIDDRELGDVFDSLLDR